VRRSRERRDRHRSVHSGTQRALDRQDSRRRGGIVSGDRGPGGRELLKQSAARDDPAFHGLVFVSRGRDHDRFYRAVRLRCDRSQHSPADPIGWIITTVFGSRSAAQHPGRAVHQLKQL
jgi:hypothetical protein